MQVRRKLDYDLSGIHFIDEMHVWAAAYFQQSGRTQFQEPVTGRLQTQITHATDDMMDAIGNLVIPGLSPPEVLEYFWVFSKKVSWEVYIKARTAYKQLNENTVLFSEVFGMWKYMNRTVNFIAGHRPLEDGGLVYLQCRLPECQDIFTTPMEKVGFIAYFLKPHKDRLSTVIECCWRCLASGYPPLRVVRLKSMQRYVLDKMVQTAWTRLLRVTSAESHQRLPGFLPRMLDEPESPPDAAAAHRVPVSPKSAARAPPQEALGPLDGRIESEQLVDISRHLASLEADALEEHLSRLHLDQHRQPHQDQYQDVWHSSSSSAQSVDLPSVNSLHADSQSPPVVPVLLPPISSLLPPVHYSHTHPRHLGGPFDAAVPSLP